MRLLLIAAFAAFFMFGTSACGDKEEDTADTSSEESEDTQSEEAGL